MTLALLQNDGKSVYKLAFAEGNRDIISLLEDHMDVKSERADLQGAGLTLPSRVLISHHLPPQQP